MIAANTVLLCLLFLNLSKTQMSTYIKTQLCWSKVPTKKISQTERLGKTQLTSSAVYITRWNSLESFWCKLTLGQGLLLDKNLSWPRQKDCLIWIMSWRISNLLNMISCSHDAHLAFCIGDFQPQFLCFNRHKIKIKKSFTTKQVFNNSTRETVVLKS